MPTLLQRLSRYLWNVDSPSLASAPSEAERSRRRQPRAQPTGADGATAGVVSRYGLRAYEGAGVGRGIGSWLGTGSSANAEVGAAAVRMRQRTRDLVRNNPHAARAIEVLVGAIVGAGIRPRARTGDVGRDREINELFDAWSAEAHTEHDLDFYGLQALCVRSWLEAGEVFVRRRARRPEDGLPVPVQIQVLEADYLDMTDNRTLPDGAGRIVQGIEFGPIDNRQAYHLYREHPGDALGAMMRGSAFGEKTVVPASAIAHLYEAQRPGQVRGVPWMAPVIKKLRDHDDYHEAEAMRKKIASCLVGVVYDNDMESSAPLHQDQDANGSWLEDVNGNPIERFVPGMFYYLRNGKDVRFNQPPADSGFEQWNEQSLRGIASGARIPYELLSGDLSKVNFSSSRVGLNEFRTMVDRLRWHVVIPLLCQPIWRWFVEAGQLSGQLPADRIPVEWDPPSFASVNPLQDATAAILRTRAGMSTLGREVGAMGYDLGDTLREIAETNAEIDALGIILDSDPRRTAFRGAFPQDKSVAEDDPLVEPTGEETA